MFPAKSQNVNKHENQKTNYNNSIYLMKVSNLFKLNENLSSCVILVNTLIIGIDLNKYCKTLTNEKLLPRN